MKVRVVPAIGGGTPIEVEVSETETVGVLKNKVCDMKKIPTRVARLTYMGRAIRDEQTIKQLGVKDGDKFILITQTVGGRKDPCRLRLRCCLTINSTHV